jgi:Ca2+-binding RTX toxin-like protein
MQTGWITPTEGLLVLDNGQGGSTITVDELFGAQSGDGFGDLAHLDSNGDGVIDASDPAFANLKVWRDLNGDGGLGEGELVSLASLGITAINLATTASGQQINGNTVVSTAIFTMAGGGAGSVSRAIAEVDFATNGLDVQYTPPSNFTYSLEAFTLPQLIGYGNVPTLWVAMSLDSTLLANVKGLVLDAGTMSGADFDAAFQALVQEWAGASDIDPTSRGAFVDARHLAVVYAFYGLDPTTQPVYQIDPNWHSGPMWESIYQSIISELEVRFASQVVVGQILNGVDGTTATASWLMSFAGISFDANSDRITVDFNALVKSIVQAAPSDPTAAAAYYERTFTIVRDLRVDLFGEDSATMATSFAVAAEKAGMGRGVEAMFFASLGMALVDEGATTGAIGGVPSGAVVYLGTGDKSVSSGANDIFVYASTGGNDTISNGGSARLVMTDIASTDVTLQRPNGGNDLLIVNNATGAVVTVAGQFAGRALANITFSDGVSYASGDISGVLVAELARYLESSTDTFAAKQQVLATFGFVSVIDASGGGTVQGTSTDDVFVLGSNATSVSGLGGNDIIASGSGDDSLNGGSGADTYLYNAGDGNDTITEGASFDGTVDQLVLGAGLTAANVAIGRSGADITLSFAGQSGSVRLVGEDGGFGTGLERIVFGNGTVWSKQNLEAAYIAAQEAVGATSIAGFDQSNDVIVGTAGADTLSGLGGNDTLTGGLGDDSLNGGSGADTYLYNAGDGNDTITEGASFDGTVDQLVLGAGLTPANVVISRSGADITLSFAGQSGSVRLVGEDGGFGTGLEQIVFGDGTAWSKQTLEAAYIAAQEAAGATSITGFDQSNDVIVGTAGADTLSGLGGNDTLTGGLGDDSLNGGSGADTYLYNAGDGNDTITESASFDGTVDQVVLSNINTSGISVVRDGGDAELVVSETTPGAGNGGTVLLKNGFNTAFGQGVEQIVFADGTTWTAANLLAQPISFGDANGDGIVSGTSGADIINFNGGGKILQGGSGSDTYVYALGYGSDLIQENGSISDTDILKFSNLNASDLTFTRSLLDSNDVLITVKSTGDVITIDNEAVGAASAIEQLQFADGTTWSQSQLLASAMIVGVPGAAANAYDTHDGSSLTYDLGAGNYTVSAWHDDPLTVDWGAGDGNQAFTIESNNFSNDAKAILLGLNPGDVTLAREGANLGDLQIINRATGKILTVVNQFNSAWQGIATLQFADGTTWSQSQIAAHATVVGIAGAAATAYDSHDRSGLTYDLGPGNYTVSTWHDDPLTVDWAAGDGNQTFTIESNNFTNDAKAILLGLNSGDVALARKGIGFGDLQVLNLATGKTLTIANQFNNAWQGIATLQFADGTIWSQSQIAANANAVIVGIAGAASTLRLISTISPTPPPRLRSSLW